MNKHFKHIILAVLVMVTLVQCVEPKNSKNGSIDSIDSIGQSIDSLTFSMGNVREARNRNCFHHRHFNYGGVCLLSSYGFLLEYANSSNEHIAPFDNFDVMEKYMLFHNLEEECPQIPAEYFRQNPIEAEKEMASAINNYCIKRGWSGYLRVNQFHDWLKENSDWAAGIEFVQRMPESLNNNGEPLEGAYNSLAGFLPLNSDQNAEYDYAALICYQTPSGPHSVLLGYDQDYFIRDVNNIDRYVDINSSFDFTYGPDAPILEYDLFKVKRQTSGPKEWIGYDKSIFSASEQDDDYFMILDNPLPLRHLRVTAQPYGANGTEDFTEIKIRSFNDPNYELVYGNYYGKPWVNVNLSDLLPLGQRYDKGTYEFDLGQISDDLYIYGYQPNFNFNQFSYQR